MVAHYGYSLWIFTNIIKHQESVKALYHSLLGFLRQLFRLTENNKME